MLIWHLFPPRQMLEHISVAESFSDFEQANFKGGRSLVLFQKTAFDWHDFNAFDVQFHMFVVVST